MITTTGRTYKSLLNLTETERGIKTVKDTFEGKLATKLNLQRVTAPRFLAAGNGLQDDLAGTQEPVSFITKFSGNKIEIVHSLAKWKRYALGKYGFKQGEGLYTDMDAIRKDEVVDYTHSIYVDQWDWELVISREQRNPGLLKEIVREIYNAILETEKIVEKEFPALALRLPEQITFINSEHLEDLYPGSTFLERENLIAEKYGAVFIIGIGHPLKSGIPHDIRAADYDDWSTTTGQGTRGLNGDIIFWDNISQHAMEISSMGIRVDAESLTEQLKMMGMDNYKSFEFHKKVLDNTLPLSIGGGIGQSRLCMFLLQKIHIGEVQVSVWPQPMLKECEEQGIVIL